LERTNGILPAIVTIGLSRAGKPIITAIHAGGRGRETNLRYYALEGDQSSPHVVAEMCDPDVAHEFLRVATRPEMLADHAEALARWETDDDTAYDAYMRVFEAELDREEAAYVASLGCS
jgi:hypothetical protein